MNRMIGKYAPDGPGGRNCHCCGQPPGAERTTARRRVKRRERQAWRQELSPRAVGLDDRRWDCRNDDIEAE